MEKPTHIKLHIDSFLFLSKLFGKYNENDDLFIELPNVDGLDDAICLINKLCSQKYYKREKQEKENFLLQQAEKIQVHFDGPMRKGLEFRAILEETANYYKDKK